MDTTAQPTFFAGIDWGSTSHQVCVLSSEGTVLGEKAFPHSGEGLAQLLDWILTCTNCEAADVAVAIELPHGPVVDSLLDRKFQVFSINPKQLDRFRDRFSPAGAKDDRRDARVLADAIRTDPDCLRELDPLDPEIIQLREWSRMYDSLTIQQTQLIHRFRDQLWRYYPQFLELKQNLSSPWVWKLWKLIPTPEDAHRRRPASVNTLLKKHRIRRIKGKQVIEILRAKPVCTASGVIEATTCHIAFLIEQLEVVAIQIQRLKESMNTTIEALCGNEDASSDREGTPADQEAEETIPTDITPQDADEPTDVEILLSVPGIGPIVLAALLSEAHSPLKTRNYQALRCLSGVAPVTRRSGKSNRVVRRRACQKRLVNALYHWGRVAIQHDPICKAKYDSLRGRGHSHPRALRSVTDRLLAVVCTMLRNRTLFEPNHANANE